MFADTDHGLLPVETVPSALMPTPEPPEAPGVAAVEVDGAKPIGMVGLKPWSRLSVLIAEVPSCCCGRSIWRIRSNWRRCSSMPAAAPDADFAPAFLP